MNINYLQQVEFYLKRFSSYGKYEKLNLLFSIENIWYSGEFFTTVKDNAVILQSFDNDLDFMDKNIGLSNYQEFKKIFDSPQNFYMSPAQNLVELRDNSKPTIFLQGLENTMNKFPIKLEEEIEPNLLNATVLFENRYMKFDYLKLNKDCKIQAFTLVTNEELNALLKDITLK